MSSTLHDNIEAIESGYEFMLAYAAQGRSSDEGTEVRPTLTAMRDAARSLAATPVAAAAGFADVVVDDARKSVAALELVLAQRPISSELVDNLNASIHLRALLTDLFLLSETVD